ncbi:hypothetical protein F4777DRAFT_313406 [Nemania sp. FL0916]|nr:hypothetical protein F4777DRAFT_313406 [Nemania sp. FL0916]
MLGRLPSSVHSVPWFNYIFRINVPASIFGACFLFFSLFPVGCVSVSNLVWVEAYKIVVYNKGAIGTVMIFNYLRSSLQTRPALSIFSYLDT